MRRRSQAREYALQILYQVDITRDKCDPCILSFWEAHEKEGITPQVKDFCADLVRGTAENLSLIDAKISQYATNWQLKRMAVVDRNIMRMGCFELIFRPDIPPKVAINEAVDLAKKYSGLEAGRFVNAILDKVKLEKDK